MEYQTTISRKDFDAADQIFKRIPEELHNKVARFLESQVGEYPHVSLFSIFMWQGFKEKALEVTKDLDHKFELGRSLGQLELVSFE